MSVHIFWDWNGTLLDDTQAALVTLNDMLTRRGCSPISMEFYRDHFGFPVKPFYTTIGIVTEREDWDAIAREYHEVYSRQPKYLNPETTAALKLARELGARQSIISALRQDLLEQDLREYGLEGQFDFVYGSDNLDGASKLSRAQALISRIPESERAGIVMIGDAVHDKEVADVLGIPCILCSQGSHAHHRLAALAPTAHTLLEAVHLALA